MSSFLSTFFSEKYLPCCVIYFAPQLIMYKDLRRPERKLSKESRYVIITCTLKMSCASTNLLTLRKIYGGRTSDSDKIDAILTRCMIHVIVRN